MLSPHKLALAKLSPGMLTSMRSSMSGDALPVLMVEKVRFKELTHFSMRPICMYSIRLANSHFLAIAFATL